MDLEITSMKTRPNPIVFLVDVDNTLLDNDGIQEDLKDQSSRSTAGPPASAIVRILEDLFAELGYRDYIGALQSLPGRTPAQSRAAADVFVFDRLPLCRAPIPGRHRGAGATPKVRPDRRPVGRRRRLPAS